ncbi:hypothetical protein, partial [Metamycoplasma hyosynoviae]
DYTILLAAFVVWPVFYQISYLIGTFIFVNRKIMTIEMKNSFLRSFWIRTAIYALSYLIYLLFYFPIASYRYKWNFANDDFLWHTYSLIIESAIFLIYFICVFAFLKTLKINHNLNWERIEKQVEQNPSETFKNSLTILKTKIVGYKYLRHFAWFYSPDYPKTPSKTIVNNMFQFFVWKYDKLIIPDTPKISDEEKFYYALAIMVNEIKQYNKIETTENAINFIKSNICKTK